MHFLSNHVAVYVKTRRHLSGLSLTTITVAEQKFNHVLFHFVQLVCVSICIHFSGVEFIFRNIFFVPHSDLILDFKMGKISKIVSIDGWFSCYFISVRLHIVVAFSAQLI